MSNSPKNDAPIAQRGDTKNYRNNRNAMRHGLRGGQLPKDCRYIELRLNGFRQALEDAVFNARGKVTIVEAATIQTCLRWERHAALAQRWLTKSGDKLKPMEQLHYSREIARASSERDKALVRLDLDREDFGDVFTAKKHIQSASQPLALPAPNGNEHEED